MTIAADRTGPASVRIAAIYTLGYTGDHGMSRALMARLAEDVDELAGVRDHASEAFADGCQEP